MTVQPIDIVLGLELDALPEAARCAVARHREGHHAASRDRSMVLVGALSAATVLLLVGLVAVLLFAVGRWDGSDDGQRMAMLIVVLVLTAGCVVAGAVARVALVLRTGEDELARAAQRAFDRYCPTA